MAVRSDHLYLVDLVQKTRFIVFGIETPGHWFGNKVVQGEYKREGLEIVSQSDRRYFKIQFTEKLVVLLRARHNQS